MFHVGVDPGATGAVAAIDSITRAVYFWDTPVIAIKSGKTFKNQMDAHACTLILQNLDRSNGVLVTIEKVNAMPGWKNDPDNPGQKVQAAMGVTSAFNFGMGFGVWIGICAASLLPYQLIHPATWKPKLMADMGKEKDASRLKAMQLYPATAKDLARKKDHARADALLLAHFGLVFGTAKPTVERVVEKTAAAGPLLFGGSTVPAPKKKAVQQPADDDLWF